MTSPGTIARLALTAAVVKFCGEMPARAVTLQSAQLGATGKFGGVSIAEGGVQTALGWRFELTSPLEVRHIGGHLLGIDEADIFAAIVRLDAIDAVPHGAPFNQDEVLASTNFTPPLPSAKVVVPLAAQLAPGAYALIFGTGELNTTGDAAMPNLDDQPDIPPTTIASFITWGRPNIGLPFEWRLNLGSHMHYEIAGATADFDSDGDVDGADFLAWQAGAGAAGTRATGDADDDLDVDADDLAMWQRQYSGGFGAPSTLVPEPPIGVLNGVAVLFAAGAGKLPRQAPNSLNRADRNAPSSLS